MARSLAEGINEGLRNYSSLSGANEAKSLNKVKTLMAIKQMQNLGAAAPEGLVRDPSTGKLVKDPSYLNPLQQRKMATMGSGDSSLSVGQRIAKDKATNAIFDTVENNKVKKKQITDAEGALPNVPQGLGGRLKVEFAKRFNPGDPMLADWQKIKMIGTDAQLLNTAKTKGAISDREMALFAEAAANDDIMSTPRLKPVLEKLKLFIDADESAKFGAYQKNYGEDPRAWFSQESGGGGNIPQFSSEEEALASGHKGPALIAGKKAVLD